MDEQGREERNFLNKHLGTFSKIHNRYFIFDVSTVDLIPPIKDSSFT